MSLLPAERRQFHKILQANPIFMLADDREVELLCQKASAIHFRRESTIFRQGEHGGAFYFIASGRLYVYVNRAGIDEHIAEIHPGEFIGEMTLFQDWGRWATVKAHEDSVLFLLDKEDIRSLLEARPSMRAMMEQLIKVRLASEMYFVPDP